MPTYADCVVSALKDLGVRRLFGMPGGGSNADVMEAAGRGDLPFSLAHTEAAAAFMATAQADVTGRSGACLATLGPGAASMTNGLANAHLDRVPLIVLTDCRTEQMAAVMEHQTLPQGEIFRPIVKFTARPQAGSGRAAIRDMVAAVTAAPPGPVHLDLAPEFTSAVADTADVWSPTGATVALPISPHPRPRSPAVDHALARARRPVFLLGLGARSRAIADAVQTMAIRFGIPALVTYKAKGVVPDRHPWFAGVLTNGALERDVLEQADVFLAVGLDPVELLPRPWELSQPIIAVTGWSMHQSQLPILGEIVGDIVGGLTAIAAALPERTDWDASAVERLAQAQRDRMRPAGEPGRLLPHRVVELVAEVYRGARVTVDAGAHMFPVLSLWPAEEPCGVLISNGLSTMGFALPAAIGAALIDDARPTIAFTGDGGLLMCVAELRTAAREQVPVRVIVFDDQTLSLIKVKQQQRGFTTRGVAMGTTRWEHVGAAFDVPTRVAADEASLTAALHETADHPGPVLIAAQIAADTYEATLRALRG